MRSRLLLAVSTLALTSASAFASIDINGGASWGGWSHRGNSLDVGIWGAQSTTRSYELYTTVFTFNNDAVIIGQIVSEIGDQLDAFAHHYRDSIAPAAN